MADTDFWSKEFQITTSISRQKLKELEFTDEEIAQINDAEMYWIAKIMSENYVTEGLLELDLRHLAVIVLRDKEKKHND